MKDLLYTKRKPLPCAHGRVFPRQRGCPKHVGAKLLCCADIHTSRYRCQINDKGRGVHGFKKFPIKQPVRHGIIDNVISSIDPGNIPTDVLVEKILTVTAKHYGVRVEDIKSKSKTDNIANARHVSVYVIKKLTDLSYKAIGAFLGGRDHSTVISSYNKIDRDISTKKNLDSDIKKIIKEVKAQS